MTARLFKYLDPWLFKYLDPCTFAILRPTHTHTFESQMLSFVILCYIPSSVGLHMNGALYKMYNECGKFVISFSCHNLNQFTNCVHILNAMYIASTNIMRINSWCIWCMNAKWQIEWRAARIENHFDLVNNVRFARDLNYLQIISFCTVRCYSV